MRKQILLYHHAILLWLGSMFQLHNSFPRTLSLGIKEHYLPICALSRIEDNERDYRNPVIAGIITICKCYSGKVSAEFL